MPVTGLETLLVAQGAKQIGPHVAGLIRDRGKQYVKRLLVRYTQTFNAHEQASYDRCSQIKNILYRDQSVALRDKYVNTFFDKGPADHETISDDEIITSIKTGCKTIISGTAGAGKTMFLRYAVLELIARKLEFQRIPIYFELRYISEDDANSTFPDVIFRRVSSDTSKDSFEKFLIGLEYGLFAFVLDAVDEIGPGFKEHMIAGMRAMMIKFPKCSYIVSTRPDPFVQTIQELTVLRTRAMTLDQIVCVIEKLDYDSSVKSRLLGELRTGLFNKHKEFLSNPLLATIMLLTYDQAADIPTKITSFYSLAFSALYQRHDAAKDTYKRGHAAGLPMDEFEKFFSALCFITYSRGRIEFSHSELKGYILESTEYLGVKVSADHLVKDCVESVCLLQPEGLQYVFVHRSFQEYFAALFVSRYQGGSVFQLIDSCISGYGPQNFVNLLDELDENIFDFQWLRTKIEEWLDKVQSLDLNLAIDLRRFMKSTLPRITIVDGKISGIGVESGTALSWMWAAEHSRRRARILMDRVFSQIPKLSGSLDMAKIVSLNGSKDFLRRLEARPQSDSEHFEITHRDARFLVHTRLPRLFSEIREEYRINLSSINERSADRKKANSLLLQNLK